MKLLSGRYQQLHLYMRDKCPSTSSIGGNRPRQFGKYRKEETKPLTSDRQPPY